MLAVLKAKRAASAGGDPALAALKTAPQKRTLQQVAAVVAWLGHTRRRRQSESTGKSLDLTSASKTMLVRRSSDLQR